MARFTDFLERFFGNENRIELNNVALARPLAEVWYKELAVKTAVSIIANAVSKCEIKFYYEGTAADDSKEYYAWNVAPNENENGNLFKNKLIQSLLLRGDALVIEDSRGNRYVADDFTVDDSNGTKPLTFSGVVVNSVTLPKTYKRREVLYFQLGTLDLTRLINNVYASYGEVLSFAIKSYKDSKSSKWKLKISAAARQKKDFKETYAQLTGKSLKAFFEGANAVYPEFDGYELVHLKDGLNGAATSSEIMELKKDIYNFVASTYKVPLSMMNGSGVTDGDMSSFLSICLEPITDLIADELTKQFFGYDSWKEGNRVEVDTAAVQHLNWSQLSVACEKLIGSGLANVDECRTKILGWNALNTEQSTKYFLTKNFADIEKSTNTEGGDEE